MISVNFHFGAEGYMGLKMLNDQHPFPGSASATKHGPPLSGLGRPIVLCE